MCNVYRDAKKTLFIYRFPNPSTVNKVRGGVAEELGQNTVAYGLILKTASPTKICKD